MHPTATVKLVGNLGRPDRGLGARKERVQQIEVQVPKRLDNLIRTLELDHGLHLPRESVLILVNGVEANALDDLDTMINENDLVVFVPMFHGGLDP
jgi:molybdopterin converting factor small subunit